MSHIREERVKKRLNENQVKIREKAHPRLDFIIDEATTGKYTGWQGVEIFVDHGDIKTIRLTRQFTEGF